jgi:hypothetical protein
MKLLRVTKHCFVCQRDETMTERDELVMEGCERISISLTDEENLVCKYCNERAIRLDIELGENETDH